MSASPPTRDTRAGGFFCADVGEMDNMDSMDMVDRPRPGVRP